METLELFHAKVTGIGAELINIDAEVPGTSQQTVVPSNEFPEAKPGEILWMWVGKGAKIFSLRKELSGAVRLITYSNVFISLDIGGELRVSPKDFPNRRPWIDQRVVVRRRSGDPQSFAGGPNADLIRILSS